jgi:hypothetical protein
VIGPQSNAGDVLDRYVDLCLGVLGFVQPTPEDRAAMADHLSAQAVLWVNDRYQLGIPAARRKGSP